MVAKVVEVAGAAVGQWHLALGLVLGQNIEGGALHYCILFKI